MIIFFFFSVKLFCINKISSSIYTTTIVVDEQLLNICFILKRHTEKDIYFTCHVIKLLIKLIFIILLMCIYYEII